MAERTIFGLVAEFDRPETLVEAARKLREAGFRRFEAYTPYPVEGLAEAVGFDESWVPLATLIGGIAGAALGYLMQVYTNLDFPVDIGGRGLVAPPAFALITVEILFLLSVIASVGAMLALNRLPRLHHPLFDVERFHLATLNRFFLVIEARDERFAPDSRSFLRGLGAVRVEEAPVS